MTTNETHPMPYPSQLLMAGDIINNGFYDIMLLDRPRMNDNGRWSAKGRRWVPSAKKWQDKVATYGWEGDPLPPHMGSWRA